MFKKRFIGVVALLALMLAGCQVQPTTPHKPSTNNDDSQASQNNNGFSR
ncbi:hypothetical protein QY884_11025 [Latilactobacillus sakei]